jgi:hypothetical protein
MKLIILFLQTVGTTDMRVEGLNYGLVSSMHNIHLVDIKREKNQRQHFDHHLVGKCRDLVPLPRGVQTALTRRWRTWCVLAPLLGFLTLYYSSRGVPILHCQCQGKYL